MALKSGSWESLQRKRRDKNGTNRILKETFFSEDSSPLVMWPRFESFFMTFFHVKKSLIWHKTVVSHGHFLRYLVFPVPKAFDRDGCNGENCIRTFHGKYLDGQWLSNPLPSLPFNRFNRIAFLQTVLKYDFGTKNSIWTKSISLNLGAKIHAYKFSYLNFQTTVEILEQCVSPVGKKGPFFRLATTNCFTYTIEVFPRLLSLFMERKIRLGWKPIFSLFWFSVEFRYTEEYYYVSHSAAKYRVSISPVGLEEASHV